jgi:integrase
MPRAVKQVLEKRPDGRYRCKYKGKEFYSSISSADALAQRQAYIDSLGKEAITPKTVSEYAIPWLKRTYPAVKSSTKTGLAIHLQHLIDEIGGKIISEVVPSDLKDVYTNQYKDCSNTYILSAKQLYCSLFDSALEDGLCKYNPARAKSAKPHRGKKPKERVLSDQERKWVETLCKDHRAYPAVMAMLYAGIRPQEMKAFDIDRDVDFKNNIITVQEQVHVDGTKYDFTDEMKTDWSKRAVPLFPPLKEALKGKHGRLITSAKGEKVTIQAWKSAWESYLFCMETEINGCQKRWYGKKKEHEGKELPPWREFDIVPYTLRHAFCCMCRDYGVEINTCRKWMGHADSKMILKVYDSVSTDRSVAESRKVEKRLNGGQNGGQKVYRLRRIVGK